MARQKKVNTTDFRVNNRISIIVYFYEDGYVEFEVKKPLYRSTPAQKEEAAYWLSQQLGTKTQNECYDLLFFLPEHD